MFNLLVLFSIFTCVESTFNVGITYSITCSQAVRQHTLFMYDTIERTQKWQPYLLMKGGENSSRILHGQTYRTRHKHNYDGLDTVVESCVSVPMNFRDFYPNLHLVWFNQGPDFFKAHSDIVENRENIIWEPRHSVNTIWTTPQYDWQGEFLKWAENASSVHSAPYLWDPRIYMENAKSVDTKDFNPGKVGVYETNRGIYKMSVVPMMIVEAANAISQVEYAEAYGLGKLNTSSFHTLKEKRFKVPWVTSASKAPIPEQWIQRNIGTVVSHTVRNGLNYLWLEAMFSGLALVHNSELLPKGCGYYYEGENITAGANALKKAMDTHVPVKDNSCIEPYSTSNPANVEWYKRLLDATLPKVTGMVTVFGETFSYEGYIPDAPWVILVNTVASAFKRREWFRSIAEAPVMFVVGDDTGEGTPNVLQRMRSEMDQHRDILVIDVREKYSEPNSSLARKVWTGLSALLKHAPSMQFALKTDHDSWLDFKVMRQEVERLTSPIYHGKIIRNQKTRNKTWHRHYAPYHKPKYPDFNSGQGYALDRLFIRKALRAPFKFNFEDVFVGMIAEQIGVRPTHGLYQNTIDVSENLRGIPNMVLQWDMPIDIDKNPEFYIKWRKRR